MSDRSRGDGRAPAGARGVGIATLALAGCERWRHGLARRRARSAGAAAGAGAGRLLFGNSTTGMLIGGAAGGLAGNMTLDRQAEERRRQQAVEDRQISQQLQLDFQRQQALQAEQTRIEIEEQRLFNEWRRSQGA